MCLNTICTKFIIFFQINRILSSSWKIFVIMNFLKDLRNNPIPLCKLNPTEFKQCPHVNRYRIPVSDYSSILTDWEISQLNPIKLTSKDIQVAWYTNSWIPKAKTNKRMVDILFGCFFFFFIKNPLVCMPHFPKSGSREKASKRHHILWPSLSCNLFTTSRIQYKLWEKQPIKIHKSCNTRKNSTQSIKIYELLLGD